MIKDLSLIRKELTGYAEVEMPYEFPIDCDIKYLTLVKEEELFSTGGKFKRICNDFITLQNNVSSWRVPICIRDKKGNISYNTRFFIPEDTNENINKPKEEDNNEEYKKIIEYQQNIIHKLTERVKEVELQKHELNETNNTYEELLQDGRYKLKELSVKYREQTEKLKEYEKLIPMLYNSR
jgi:hypothetical protein